MSVPHFMPARKYDFPDLPQAVCQQVDPELFFPEQGESLNPARKICARCEDRLDCLQWALDHDEGFGVWGGLSPHQRTLLRNKKGAA